MDTKDTKDTKDAKESLQELKPNDTGKPVKFMIPLRQNIDEVGCTSFVSFVSFVSKLYFGLCFDCTYIEIRGSMRQVNGKTPRSGYHIHGVYRYAQPRRGRQGAMIEASHE